MFGHSPATLLRFLLVGGGAALLLWVLGFLLLSAGVQPFIAGCAAYAVSFCVAYLLQRGYTFAGRHAHREALPRYVAAQACAGLVAGVATALAQERLGLGHELSSAAGTIAASATSLLLTAFWVFPGRRQGEGFTES